MREVVVYGSHGRLFVHAETGRVLHYEPEGNDVGYEAVTFVNLTEWKAAHNTPKLPEVLDILDVGYWLRDGVYEAPDESWRVEFGPEGTAYMEERPII